MNNCYFCGTPFEGTVYKSTECSSCHKDIKICMNCAHYDKSAYHECRESQAEYVSEKTKANFCGYFKAGGTRQQGSDPGSDAKARFEGLFS